MLLDILRCHQPISRADVTELTDLTQQSVHRILEGLIADGLVVTERGRPSGRGKPSPMLKLNDAARFSIGIALERDSCQINLVNLNTIVIADDRINGLSTTTPQGINRIVKTCEQLLLTHRVTSSELAGIGIAAGHGLSSPSTDSAVTALAAALSDAFNVNAYIENKALAAAIGESLTGIGRCHKDFAFISLDHDVSGGLIRDGVPFRGHSGHAGDYRLLMAETGPVSAASLSALLSGLRAGGQNVADLVQLQQTFDPDWAGVTPWLQEAVTRLNMLVAALTGIFDPQAIVFGGQIPALLGQLLIERIEKLHEQRSTLYARPMPLLMLSKIEGDGAATGAALLPLKHRYYR